MNAIQLTPAELVSFVAEMVTEALGKAMKSLAPVQTRSVAAMRQARYRQRVKERELAGKQREAVVCDTKSAAAAPILTPVTRDVSKDVTSVSRDVTNVLKASRETPDETLSNPDPLPPSSPLPPSPQTPLSPAPLHPPTPVAGAHAYVREGGEAGGEGSSNASGSAEPTMQPNPDAVIPCSAPGLGPDDIAGLADPACVTACAADAAVATADPAAATARNVSADFSLGTLRMIADDIAEKALRRQQAERQARELAEARRLEEARQKRELELAAEAEVWRAAAPQVARLTAIFDRKDRELRSSEEKPFLAQRIVDEDLTALEAYYAAHWPPQQNKNYLRHDLQTLLENYPREVDRARTWQRQEQKRLAPATLTPPAVKRGFFAGTVLEGRTG